jgi:hypothetical protein
VEKTPCAQVYSVFGSSAALRLAACYSSGQASSKIAVEGSPRYPAKGDRPARHHRECRRARWVETDFRGGRARDNSYKAGSGNSGGVGALRMAP